MKKLLSIKETAEYLNVHWQTVRKYIKQGTLKSIKIGRSVRIEKSELERFLRIQKPKENKVEIERKYIIKDRKSLENKLLELDARVTFHAHVVDYYYIPNKIRNLDELDKWFKSTNGFSLRIRETNNDYSGNIETTITIKKLTQANDHGIHEEVEFPTESHESTKELFRLMGLKENVIVDKDRVIYSHKDVKVCIDEIKGAGVGVEIEYRGDSSENEALRQVEKLANLLGLSNEQVSLKGISYIPFLNGKF